jgi:6-phosphogluconolactonase
MKHPTQVLTSCAVALIVAAVTPVTSGVRSTRRLLQGGTQHTFAYTINNVPFQRNAISGWKVGANGALKAVPGSPRLTGGEGTGSSSGTAKIITCPGRNLLYASNNRTGDISAFSINPQNGRLTVIPGSPFPCGSGFGISLAITNDNQYLFAGDAGTNTILVFRVLDNGGLTPLPNLAMDVPGGLTGIKVSPNGAFLAAVNGGGIAILNIASDGSLSQIPGSPFRALQDDSVRAIDINCANDLLFCTVSSLIQGFVRVFSMAPSGALTLKPELSLELRSEDIIEPCLSPDGRFLFVSDVLQQIHALSVAADGSLMPVPGSPFHILDGSFLLTTDQSGRFLMSTFLSGLNVFEVQSTGALSLGKYSRVGIAPRRPGGPLPSPEGVAVYPRATCSDVRQD